MEDRETSSKGALKLGVPEIDEFYHRKKDGEEATQFCVENDYEDDENDAYEIVNPTRPR